LGYLQLEELGNQQTLVLAAGQLYAEQELEHDDAPEQTHRQRH
jgi:hypothetical protein